MTRSCARSSGVITLVPRWFPEAHWVSAAAGSPEPDRREGCDVAALSWAGQAAPSPAGQRDAGRAIMKRLDGSTGGR